MGKERKEGGRKRKRREEKGSEGREGKRGVQPFPSLPFLCFPLPPLSSASFLSSSWKRSKCTHACMFLLASLTFPVVRLPSFIAVAAAPPPAGVAAVAAAPLPAAAAAAASCEEGRDGRTVRCRQAGRTCSNAESECMNGCGRLELVGMHPSRGATGFLARKLCKFRIAGSPVAFLRLPACVELFRRCLLLRRPQVRAARKFPAGGNEEKRKKKEEERGKESKSKGRGSEQEADFAPFSSPAPSSAAPASAAPLAANPGTQDSTCAEISGGSK